MLYYEPRLSKGQDISCNSCHMLDKYGVDLQPTSDGHKGKQGDRNSPTVYNAAGHFVQFWDGRAADVEEQAKGPVMNPVEMAMPSEKRVVAVLKSIPEYVELFKQAFPEDKDPVSYRNMARAIGAFERKLVTPSRWDKFLRGDSRALTNEEKAGFNLFMETGCQACHMGTYLGGNMYQMLGLAKPWPDASDPGPRESDQECGGPHDVQGPGIAQYRGNETVLSQRQGSDAGAGGFQDGRISAGEDSDRWPGPIHHRVSKSAYRRDPG